MLTCPVCAEKLVVVERQGIELDTCFTCGGTWVDQGELDELVRREALEALALGHKQLMEKREHRVYDRIESELPIITKPFVKISTEASS
jgi:uncharacterized protein